MVLCCVWSWQTKEKKEGGVLCVPETVQTGLDECIFAIEFRQRK